MKKEKVINRPKMFNGRVKLKATKKPFISERLDFAGTPDGT